MKKLFFVLLILSGVSFSFLYYSWRQATQLPEWYTNQSRSTQNTLSLGNESDVIAAQARLKEKIEESIAKSLAKPEETSLPLTSPISSQTPSFSPVNNNSAEGEISKSKNVEIELSNQDVNDFVMTTIAKQESHSQVLANAQGFHTTIQDGRMDSGAVVNFADIPKNKLAETEKHPVGKVLEAFPLLENKEVYIGLSGKPRIENGQLKLDKDTKIKIGNLSLSLSEVSQKLGIPQEEIEQKLNHSLQAGDLKVNEMELTESKILLRGSLKE